MKEAVILVHGLWTNGMEMWRLRQHLSSAGYDCYLFHYSSMRSSPEENAQRLNEYAKSLSAPVVHFVCHSLGGLVVLHLFDQYPTQKPGRIVLLGTPVNGSMVAQRLYKNKLTRWLLGRSVDDLASGHPHWFSWRDLGIIAGTLPIGAGILLGGLKGANDGTVAVDEAVLHGATDFITLPVSHTGLLYSEQVAVQVVTFLRAGKFGDEAMNLLLDAAG